MFSDPTQSLTQYFKCGSHPFLLRALLPIALASCSVSPRIVQEVATTEEREPSGADAGETQALDSGGAETATGDAAASNSVGGNSVVGNSAEPDAATPSAASSRDVAVTALPSAALTSAPSDSSTTTAPDTSSASSPETSATLAPSSSPTTAPSVTTSPSATTPTALTPFQVGRSIFSDSASGDGQANGHLEDATFAKPQDTQAGDFLLVFFGADHTLSSLDQDTLNETGWTVIADETYGKDEQSTYLLYRFTVENEPNSFVFKNINSAEYPTAVQGLLQVYRGVSRAAPINAFSTVTQDADLTPATNVTTPTPVIETTVANCLAIAGLSPDTAIDSPQITAWPAGFTLNSISVVNPRYPYPNGWANIYAAERALPTAGTLAASEFAWKMQTGTYLYGALSFVLALAPER